MRLFIAALLVLPLPALGAEYAHCYAGPAPEDAKVFDGPNPLDGFGDTLGVAAIRHACGADTTIEKEALAVALEGAQCSETSQIATRTIEMMTTESSALAVGYQAQLGLDDAGFETFCAAIEPCMMAEGDENFAPACFESISKALGG